MELLAARTGELAGSRDLLVELRLERIPALRGPLDAAPGLDAGVGVQPREPELRAALPLDAAAELVERDGAVHVADRIRGVDDLEVVPREPEAELDVLRPEREGRVEETAAQQERALARAPAAPEVGVVERLAVDEAVVGEEVEADVGDEVHQRRDLEPVAPRRVAEHRDVLLGPLGVDAQVLGEQTRVGHVVVVEEQHDLAARGADARVLGGGDAGVRNRDVAQGQPLGELGTDRTGAVGRAVVDDDDLEAIVRDRLQHEALEHVAQQLRALVRRDDHAQLAGHAASPAPATASAGSPSTIASAYGW